MKKLLFLFCLIVLLAGCQSKKEKFLQGEWENENEEKIVFDGNKTYYDVNGEKSKEHKFKVRKNNDDNIIIVESTGYAHGNKIVSRYEIEEDEKNHMYFSDYWGENKNGNVFHEAEGGEDLVRVDKSSNDSSSATIILIIIAIVGILVYRKKKCKIIN